MTLRALEGFVVGITADRRWMEQAELLQRRGASVVHGPTMRTEYLASDEALRTSTLGVIAARPDFLVATTGIGVRAWFEAAQAWGLAEGLAAALSETRVVARGPKAAAAVGTAGLKVWQSPDTERLDDALGCLARQVAGKTVAFQHYGERNDDAVSRLTGWGASVVEVPIYRWHRPTDDGPARRLVDAVCDGGVDAVTFTSAPAVHNFIEVARGHDRLAEVLDAFNGGDVIAACIGPVCAEGARQEGVETFVAPGHGRLGLLVRALTDALQGRRESLVLAGQTVVVQGRAVAVDATVVDLSGRDRAVFDALLRRRGTVVSKPAMLKALGAEPTAGHALEASVARLRKRLGPAGGAIRSVRSRGYILEASPADCPR
jgi:uroporphyrinogen-III synthase